MTANGFDGLDDAPGFWVERLTSFLVEGDMADEDDELDEAAQLSVLEGGAQTVDAGVVVEAEGAGVVGGGVPVRVDQYRGSAEFVESV